MTSKSVLPQGEVLATISNELVRLYRVHYGKGPNKAKTYAIDDAIICVLKGGLMAVEQTLIADGKSAQVAELRRSFQRTMRDRFTSLVEDATGRKVIAYLSQVHTDPDIAVEVFFLQPYGAEFDGQPERDSTVLGEP